MENKHTPTPWKIDRKASLRIISGETTVAICSRGQSGDNLEEEQANATLIVTAVNEYEDLQYRLRVQLIDNGMLDAKIKQLQADNERMKADMEWFCKRVEDGEVRSVKTYNRFKQALNKTT